MPVSSKNKKDSVKVGWTFVVKLNIVKNEVGSGA
jgi:hypothetical protein